MISWSGVSCCFSAAIFYLLGRSSGRDADFLRSVTKVNQLKDLAVLLDAAYKVLPLVVAICGRVGSETPIHCEQSGLRGVIVEETEEQHFLKHNDAGSWIQDSALIRSTAKEVPWYLAVKDDVGTIRIQKPHNDQAFMTSQKSIDQLISNLRKWTRLYQFASMGFTVFGVYLLAKSVLQYIREQRRHMELQKRVLAAAAQREVQDPEDSDEKIAKSPNNSKWDCQKRDTCVICLDQEYNAVFVPCGHMCCCTSCSSHLTSCPLCRRRIDQVLRTFRH